MLICEHKDLCGPTILGDVMPPFVLCRYQTHIWCTYINARKSLIYKNISNNKQTGWSMLLSHTRKWRAHLTSGSCLEQFTVGGEKLPSLPWHSPCDLCLSVVQCHYTNIPTTSGPQYLITGCSIKHHRMLISIQPDSQSYRQSKSKRAEKKKIKAVLHRTVVIK